MERAAFSFRVRIITMYLDNSSFCWSSQIVNIATSHCQPSNSCAMQKDSDDVRSVTLLALHAV